MSVNLSKIDLRKKQVIDLKKKSNILDQKAQVCFAMDISGSMLDLYRNGTVQDVFERILPLGLAFDDDQAVDLFLFHDKSIEVSEQIKIQNIDDFVNKKIMGKYEFGGTNYAPVLKAILQKYGKFKKVEKTEKTGFLGMFSKKTEDTKEPDQLDLPVYVVMITDGENSDKREAEEIVREMSAHGIFIQFVGIGSASFNFLMNLDNLSGRKIDNANFFKVDNIKTVSDDKLYSLLMAEFPMWIPLARQHKMIK